jgi:hypothetical protein
MLHDDAGGVDEDGDGTPDEIEEVGDVLWDLHDLIFCAYDYYCGCGKNIQSMALNQWTDFIEDCKLVDRKSKFCKKADIDRLFITVDSRMGKPSKQLSRIEFLAALVHLGINRYVLPGVVSDVSEALSKLLQEDVEARLPAEIFEEANHFRTHFCYREDVSETLAKHEVSLRRLFMGISASDGGEVGQKHMASLCSFSEWQMFVKLCKLIGPDLTERDAKLSFAWARMAVINGASEQGAELLNHSNPNHRLQGHMAIWIVNHSREQDVELLNNEWLSHRSAVRDMATEELMEEAEVALPATNPLCWGD